MPVVKQICVRTSEEIHWAVKEASHNSRMSVNQWIIQAIKRELGDIPAKGLAPGVGNEQVVDNYEL